MFLGIVIGVVGTVFVAVVAVGAAFVFALYSNGR